VSWQQVRGHDALIAAFDRTWQRGRLAHAYLFTGPPGIGKRHFALELAKALLCEVPARPHLEACDQCPACALVAAGTHPDLFTVVRPEDTQVVPIAAIRELCQGLSLKAARGHGKVALVDDADDLNAEAANCFLKTLEEPPSGSVLFLIGTSADVQLPTIVSRCQVVPFKPLPDALVGELLRTQGLEDGALVERLVRLSGGSPGQALALADPALWEFRRTLLQGLMQLPRESVALAQAWSAFAETAGKGTPDKRRRAALTLRLLIEFLSSALTLSVGGTPAVVEPDDLRTLEGLVQRSDPDRLLSLLERCLEAEMHLDRQVQLVLLLEGLVEGLGQLSR
jgi:DNA polymerase-3 subunit delta'